MLLAAVAAGKGWSSFSLVLSLGGCALAETWEVGVLLLQTRIPGSSLQA